MSRKNEKYFEQKVGWYRHLFTVFSAVNIGCIAWLVSSYDRASQSVVYLDILAILAASFSTGIVVSKIRKYIKLLREE